MFGESSASALGFLGEVIFKWMPSILTVMFESVQQPTTGVAATMPSPLIRPLSTSDFSRFLENASTFGVYDSLVEGWQTYTIFSPVFSIPFLIVIIYCLVRVFLLRQHEARMLRVAQKPVAAQNVPKTLLRWNRILEQTRSDNEHNWRLAILEADIMLNELLDVRGYKGETMADKMKQVDRADFNSIDAAWEAHKMRNRIVHEGTGHALSSRETRRVIELYEQVFREFGYIE